MQRHTASGGGAAAYQGVTFAVAVHQPPHRFDGVVYSDGKSATPSILSMGEGVGMAVDRVPLSAPSSGVFL
jgi:hypothetical protein